MAETLDPKGTGTSNVQKPFLSVDPFELPLRVKTCLRSCSTDSTVSSAKYLWVHLGESSDSDCGCHGDDLEPVPSLEQWLNVVDEAASLGVRWIVLSVNKSLTAFPEVVEVCQWAQETHGMTVGLHVDRHELSAEELETLSLLDRGKTQVVAKKEAADGLKTAQEAGFDVVIADPQPYGERPDCQGPKEMLFISPRGQLFTCGLVEDRHEYALGNIFIRSFRDLLTDPSLPHVVHPKDHKVTQGCDGCPSLLANFLKEPVTQA